MGKRYIVAILIVIFAYAAIILWYHEGSEIFQKFFSRQGQVVTSDQQSYQSDEEYQYPEQGEGQVSTTSEQVFAPGNFVNSEGALDFAKELEDLAVNEITSHIPVIKKQMSGNDVAILLRSNQEVTNDFLFLDTIDNNKKSLPFIDAITRLFEWLSGTQS